MPSRVISELFQSISIAIALTRTLIFVSVSENVARKIRFNSENLVSNSQSSVNLTVPGEEVGELLT
jgi:hypothetical protein